MKATVGYVENISIDVDASPEDWTLLYEALRAVRKTKAQKARLQHFADIIEPHIISTGAPQVTNVVEIDGSKAD